VKAVGSRTSRRQISFTCGRCHAKIAEEYRKSVHGAALMATDNPDVPTCVDCHQAHQTANPRSPRFRAESPKLCGKCHADPKLMKKYGLSTQVFQTYVADFHGTTAELFEEVTPDQPLNQAVCYDCHGYHDVYRVHGVGRKKINQNLLKHCQRCHPAATTKFLSAWTSHYIPSPTKYPWIYYVKLFYRFAIPSIVGFFLLFIATDVYRHRRSGRHGGGA
jgi:Doubled CXXCH motif (Paired_CXXCH_1).